MLEHPQQLNITQSELASRVADYFDTLLAQRDAILERYGLTPETAEQFCDLQSTDEDRESILALYENMVYVLQNKEIPPSELLEQERIKEQHRINEFFGTDANIEVPQLPKTITPERIEQWKQKHFELRYLPPLTLGEESNYPGWKKKPIDGINFFSKMEDIARVSENIVNPHLENLKLNELPGRWMLIDTRTPPEIGEAFVYEDDAEIAHIIATLNNTSVLRRIIPGAGRNYLHPDVFSKPEFWQPFYEYLGIRDDDCAVIRLPRLIEQSVFQQDVDNGINFSGEWMEEFYIMHGRLRLVKYRDRYIQSVSWGTSEEIGTGFRCVVMF